MPLQKNPQKEELDDAELIRRINSGDFEAFNILYYRHRDWIFRIACRITGASHMADDVMQEVFRYFLNKFPGFTLTCAMRTFFYPVIRNISLNMLRKARRYEGGPVAENHLDNLPTKQSPSSGFDEIEVLIAHLGDTHREVLIFKFVDGMTVPEIAELVGIPPGTVKSRLHHALAALRENPEFRRRHELNERFAGSNG